MLPFRNAPKYSFESILAMIFLPVRDDGLVNVTMERGEVGGEEVELGVGGWRGEGGGAAALKDNRAGRTSQGETSRLLHPLGEREENTAAAPGPIVGPEQSRPGSLSVLRYGCIRNRL